MTKLFNIGYNSIFIGYYIFYEKKTYCIKAKQIDIEN